MEDSPTSGACPRCGEVGRPVPDETIRTILKPEAFRLLLAIERRFCRSPNCSVLYYGADGRVVEKCDATLRVGSKETEDPIPLCYCFGYTREDVQREVAQAGSSTIPARIASEIRAGRWQCQSKNPSGTFCLGDVLRAVRDVQDRNGQARGP